MLILHDPSTLLHSTLELLGARLIPALEDPERITAILKSVSASHHQLHTLNFKLPAENTSAIFEKDGPQSDLLHILSTTHSIPYLIHLRTIFQTWLDAGLVEENSSILPECFPFPTNHGQPPLEPKDPFARVGFYAFDMSSGITKNTYTSTLASANLALEGVKLLLGMSTETSPNARAGSFNTVLALTRPPGHHCDGARCGGYCYINNAALAVTAYQMLSSTPAHSTVNPTTNPKVAILDLDFHHGNGTQSIFYSDPSVLYASIHGKDEFPYYTGSASETGAGAGQGFNLNLPLAIDSSYASYEQLLDVAIGKIKEYRAKFLIVSLGFDTFELDPLGKFTIETGDYERMARKVRRGVMNEPGGGEKGIGKALILLEGGYVIDRLGDNLLSFLKGWEED